MESVGLLGWEHNFDESLVGYMFFCGGTGGWLDELAVPET